MRSSVNPYYAPPILLIPTTSAREGAHDQPDFAGNNTSQDRSQLQKSRYLSLEVRAIGCARADRGPFGMPGDYLSCALGSETAREARPAIVRETAA